MPLPVTPQARPPHCSSVNSWGDRRPKGAAALPAELGVPGDSDL